MSVSKETIDAVRSAKAAAIKDYEKLGERLVELRKLLAETWPKVELGGRDCCKALNCVYIIDPDDQENLHCPLHFVLRRNQ